MSLAWKKQDPLGMAGPAHEIATTSPDDDIRTLVVAEVDHAIVTWAARRRIWQYWHHNGASWQLVAEHPSAAAAKRVAEDRRAEDISVAMVRDLPSDTAVTVQAEWDLPYNSNRPMRVPCSSPATAEEVAKIFRRIGCHVHTEIDKAVA